MSQRSAPRITVISSLYRCAQYLEEYFRALALMEHPDEIEVLLLHNDPTTEELEIIERCRGMVSVDLRHVHIAEREGLYKTWNRGVSMARGEFLAVWNVDDQRSPNSLHLQANALDARPDACLCYGSYIGVQRFAAREGLQYVFPEYDPWTFLRSCFLTPFPLWRASLHQTIGMFDEGFRSAGDYDFQLRAARSAPFVRIDDVCGFYLEAPESGISKSGDINNIERTVCELRYGIYDKLNLLYLNKARKYSMNSMRWDDAQHSIANHFASWSSYRSFCLLLAPLSLFRVPINVARYVKHRLLPKWRAARQLRSQTVTPPAVSLP